VYKKVEHKILLVAFARNYLMLADSIFFLLSISQTVDCSSGKSAECELIGCQDQVAVLASFLPKLHMN
jgi:hypothetical protein